MRPFRVGSRRLTERGEGKGQFFITAGVILVIAFVLYKFVPVYYNTADFNREFEDLARTSVIRGEDEKKIRERFIKIRNEYNIPEETCKFDLTRKQNQVTYTVEYQVPITFPGYTYIWADKREVTETGGKY
ncbi:MAG: hypothetical protein K1Y36_21150 [Blastocatellia bacterium]|nr:hypothetical protein [Blastocatellia bacterium]